MNLSHRLQTELKEIDGILERIEVGWQRAQDTGDDLYLDSVALNLHDFYAGLERVFSLIAATIDGNLPKGANWHQMLLSQMAEELPGVRPAVISARTKSMLETYLGFRHVVRHVYAYKFNPSKMKPLVEELPTVFARLQEELIAFARFLESHR
jgi:hypothetical protein